MTLTNVEHNLAFIERRERAAVEQALAGGDGLARRSRL